MTAGDLSGMCFGKIRRVHLFWVCVLCGLCGHPSSVSALENQCDAVHVRLEGASFVIDPTGFDDTQNIQCAVDSAVQQGIERIKLSKGTFRLSQLYVDDFVGVLSGVSKANTLLEVQERSVACAAMEETGETPAAIKIVEGATRIQNMTISADNICSVEGDLLPYVIHFSGTVTGGEECSNDVTFGVIDRVDLSSALADSPGEASLRASDLGGILAAAEGFYLGGCKQNLLGTLKINRSSIKNFRNGVLTSLRSGAQVDINYNNFEENYSHLSFIDSNQITYVVKNVFGETFYAVRVERTEGSAPKRSKFTINENSFELSRRSSIGIYFELLSYPASIRPLITDNSFSLQGGGYGLLSNGISGGFFARNFFEGKVGVGIYLSSGSDNWVISNNTGFASLDAENEDISIRGAIGTVLDSNGTYTLYDSGTGTVEVGLSNESSAGAIIDSGSSGDSVGVFNQSNWGEAVYE